MTKINCFIPFANAEQAQATVDGLKSNPLVNKIYLLANDEAQGTIEGCEMLKINNLNSTATIKAIADKSDACVTMLYTKYVTLKFAPYAIDRFVKILADTQSGMVYADHYNVTDKGADKAPVIDYQMGSLRDDFDFDMSLPAFMTCASSYRNLLPSLTSTSISIVTSSSTHARVARRFSTM